MSSSEEPQELAGFDDRPMEGRNTLFPEELEDGEADSEAGAPPGDESVDEDDEDPDGDDGTADPRRGVSWMPLLVCAAVALGVLAGGLVWVQPGGGESGGSEETVSAGEPPAMGTASSPSSSPSPTVDNDVTMADDDGAEQQADQAATTQDTGNTSADTSSGSQEGEEGSEEGGGSEGGGSEGGGGDGNGGEGGSGGGTAPPEWEPGDDADEEEECQWWDLSCWND